MLAIAACTSPKPGWTYAPAPSATPIPSVEASGSAAPSGSAAASAPASAAASAPASASTGGTVLQVEAEGIAFKESTLTAPANQPFKIDFKNNDAGTPHNVVVFDGGDATAPVLFSGDLVTGPATKDYTFEAPPPGTYFFHCEVHPQQMTGTLVVK